MPRLRSSEAPSTEMLSRLNRHFAGCAAVIAGAMVVGAASTSADAAVVATTTNTTTTSVLGDPLYGGGYYKPGGLYVDFADGTIATSGAAPATSGSATTGAPSWNVHLFAASYSGYYHVQTTYAETAQVFLANGSASGQYADIVSSSGNVAAVLTPGTVVGASSLFGTGRRESLDTNKDGIPDTSSWMPGTSGYLGVEFLDSNNALHYGYIQMTLGSSYPESITVTSFAYETTPGLAITIPSAVPEPASLGALGIGSLALGLRRRRAR